jgi:hypothetical protein
LASVVVKAEEVSPRAAAGFVAGRRLLHTLAEEGMETAVVAAVTSTEDGDQVVVGKCSPVRLGWTGTQAAGKQACIRWVLDLCWHVVYAVLAGRAAATIEARAHMWAVGRCTMMRETAGAAAKAYDAAAQEQQASFYREPWATAGRAVIEHVPWSQVVIAVAIAVEEPPCLPVVPCSAEEEGDPWGAAEGNMASQRDSVHQEVVY